MFQKWYSEIVIALLTLFLMLRNGTKSPRLRNAREGNILLIALIIIIIICVIIIFFLIGLNL